MQKTWEIRDSDEAEAEELSRNLGVHPVIAGLLVSRGIKTVAEGQRFLSPSLQDLSDPKTMQGVAEAVDRLIVSMRQGEKICVYGDYDVDGVTSVTLLLLFLRKIGLTVDYYIPSRLEEGYGLNETAVAEIAAQGTKLLITVDCGISDSVPILAAKKAGLDVIVIDHHQVPSELPAAVAVLDPHREDCQFPAKNLAAVGVTFCLVMALRARLRDMGSFDELPEPNLREYMDLVCLGTVADIVPLLEDNRILTHFGLMELSSGRRPGVAALKEVAGMLTETVNAGQIAYRLAPRINAVGRMGRATEAVELLSTRSYSHALKMARKLDEANTQRQAVEQKIFEDALAKAEKERKKGEPRALVLASEHWHAGVVGIVASKLVERFACPVVMIAMDGETGKGSARSTGRVHLYQALCGCADTLEGFGGHQAAAGLTIRKEMLEAFRNSFLRVVNEQVGDQALSKTIKVDGEVSPAIWTRELVEKIEALAPYGAGNPEPKFIAKAVEVRSARNVGRDAPFHLKLTLTDGKSLFDAIGFGLGDHLRDIGNRIDIVYSAELNRWEGRTSVQLKLYDLHPSEQE